MGESHADLKEREGNKVPQTELLNNEKASLMTGEPGLEVPATLASVRKGSVPSPGVGILDRRAILV